MHKFCLVLLFSKWIFCHSLESLDVIQIEKNIDSELTTKKYYPKDLIDKTAMIIKEIPDSFVKDQDFYNRIFDTIVRNTFSVWNKFFFI